MADYIVEFEHRERHGDLINWLKGEWVRTGNGPVPSLEAATEMVLATVNHGRWIAECPNGCRYAILVSEAQPFFLCANGGAMCNGGQWLRVVFPKEKRAIEAELLKRPARHPFYADTRNWIPGQSVAELRGENASRGIS